MSAYLAGQSTTAQQVVVGHPDFAVVAFNMATARDKSLGVVRNPLTNDPDHVLIFGKKTDSTRRTIAKACTWVVPPPLSVCKAPDGKCVCFSR